jgi:predicted kinase
VTLVVVCGVPGVGKTSVAGHLADRLGADMLRTDVVRKDLFDDPEYTDQERKRVYEELLSRAETHIGWGDSVVLDGTFHDRDHRLAARSTAGRTGVDCRFVKVECDPAVARRRIRAREEDESDADVEVHAMFREQFDPLEVDHVTVDNSGELAATRQQVDERVLPAVPGVGDAV